MRLMLIGHESGARQPGHYSPHQSHRDIHVLLTMRERRQEKGVIRDQTKEHLYETVKRAWPDIGLSKQSDLHVYFWPVAAQFLADDGWFGFLTSSSWLDVRYGFSLQRWILRNFRLVAVIESLDEPWFEDARVKTAVTILQRTPDEDRRNNNTVRFVRLFRPLADILGVRS